ncbi:MAG: LicD family protein [Erysipelotrichaceae bacterium]
MIEASEQVVKERQISILDQVKKYCGDHKINYFLTGGTCIGAIRHNGFIPWDDDIDISMLRKDYEDFIEHFNSTKSKYQVYTCENESSYPFPFAKIVDLTTIYVEANDELKMEMGINIDLFPIDRLPDQKYLSSIIQNSIKFLRNVIYVKAIDVKTNRGTKKNMILNVTKVLGKAASSNSISKIINSIARNTGDATSKKGGILVWGYGKREIVEMDVFRDTVILDFEGRKHTVPVGYHDWLTSIYGNYMQLPPVEKQVTHHQYKAFIK